MFSFIFSIILSITETNAQVTVLTLQSFVTNFAGPNSLNGNANGIQTFTFNVTRRTGDRSDSPPPTTTVNPLSLLFQLYLRGLTQASGTGFPSFPQMPGGGFSSFPQMPSGGFPSFPQYGYPYYPYYGGYRGYGYSPYSYYYYYYG
ncbi:hypothetical protein LOAG_14704 [Loa loa]|uniref:Uncharacterized protein n=1 Tax=Loa loa TaxID=7209 RepID=A0A1S0TIJ8_LOALO|nr:hypothetical protein LOAG_14704 [Loa loa]EFO13822.1 hypothetical protein LOAG_14704 [Loa loa]